MPLLRMWYASCNTCNATHYPDADRRWKAAVDMTTLGWHRVGAKHNNGNRWICPRCWTQGRR